MNLKTSQQLTREEVVGVKNKFGFTTFSGFAISGIGVALAIWSPRFLGISFIYLSGILAIIGLWLCLLTPLSRKMIAEPLSPYQKLIKSKLPQLIYNQKLKNTSITPLKNQPMTGEKGHLLNISANHLIHLSIVKVIIKKANQLKLIFSHFFSRLPIAGIMIFLGQVSLLLLSFLFFNFMETQTRINPRLHALLEGEVFYRLKSDLLLVGLLPWVIYAIVGVGFAYLSVSLGRTPYLPEAILPKTKRQPWLFIHNFLSIIVEVNILFPIIFVTAFSMIYICETGNSFLGSISLFHAPILTMLVLGMLILTFRRLNARCIDWLLKKEITLGNILLLLVLTFAFFMLWLHTIGSNFLIQMNRPELLNIPKSPWVGNLSESVLERRLPLFIWGWWMVWIPWMTTFIARWSIGFSVRQALFRALILPLALFAWIALKATLEDWVELYKLLNILEVRIAIGIGLLLFIWVLWGRVRNTMELSLGCMLPLKRWKIRSLRNWARNFSLCIPIYISGWFAMGWIPAQVISSYGGGFLTLLVAFYLGVLIMELRREQPKVLHRIDFNHSFHSNIR